MTSKVWNRTVHKTNCKSCGKEFQPTNNRTYECYECVPKEHRVFNNRLRGHYGRDFGYVAYFKMLDSQDGNCKVCGIKVIPRTRGNNKDSAVVDHCHETGEVRGILCRTCNLGLGHFNDDVVKLINAIKYLKENKE